MASGKTFVDVILPLALPQAYTYALPFDIAEFVKTGHRVIVQFGKNRYYSAIVSRIHHNEPSITAKLIEGLADEEPIVTEKQLKFWDWMSRYYLCQIGEVMNAALPGGLKLSSETRVRYNETYEGDFENLSDEEFVIIQALRAQGELSVPQVQDLLKKKNVYPLLRSLFNAGIAVSSEELIERYKPRTAQYVKLNDRYHDDKKLEQLFEELSRAPKQVELLLAFTQLKRKAKFISKNELLELSRCSAAVLSALVKRDVFQEFKVEVSRLGTLMEEELESPVPAEEQIRCLHEINRNFTHKNTVLLHGVTGSGKTVVYIEKIKEIIAQEKQVLYLLPEIALTAQIINRLRKVFGSVVGIYHSKFNPNERVEIWNKVLRQEYKIVIGARSGLFLPFQNLGLIIIDEEHDNSLKQMSPAPRYQARDSAIMLASLFEAKVLLGTATPAIETLYNCEREKYGMVRLDKRFGDLDMPEIVVANIRDHQRKKKMQGCFTKALVDEISMALQNREQVILFLNRRGFANYQTCKTCNYVYTCRHCDVSLTYHKFQNQLVCHYCGYTEKLNIKCKSCGAVDLDIIGMGTEKIEDEITGLFPQARVARFDYDSTKNKDGHSKVIARFENREVDILVGTQMVSKGLDFDHVSLVGIINADQLIHHPGFRSHERAYQLLTQVSGRAGRKHKRGKVVLQTSDPLHPVIQQVLGHDYKGMYERELRHRRQFGYPPFARMIEFSLQHREVRQADHAALYLATAIRKLNAAVVLGPAVPLISKINNQYQREVLVKSGPMTTDLQKLKDQIRHILDVMKTMPEIKGVHITANVDP